MFTKIICSEGLMHWVDLNTALIEEVFKIVDGRKVYRLVLNHPALKIQDDYISCIALTDFMEKDELKIRYGAILPVVITLNFSV